MKKIVCFVLGLLILIFLINSVFAISTTIKDSYLQGETIISEISGNILKPITNENVEFRRGHVLVPFEYDLKKLGEKYYVWFITPENEINYTIYIKDIATSVSGKISQITYEKNFSVSGNLTDYSVKPGFVLADKDFEIEVQLNEDYEKSIDIKFIEESNFTLKPGKNTIKFSVSEINETKTFNLVIGKYKIPAYIRENKTGKTNYEINLTIGNETILNLSGLLDIDITNLSEEEKEIVESKLAEYRCAEYPGKVCAADEKCSVKTITTSDETSCCPSRNGVCKKEESSGYAWVGYVLGALVIILGIFIWIKYKKVKAEKNPIGSKIKSL